MAGWSMLRSAAARPEAGRPERAAAREPAGRARAGAQEAPSAVAAERAAASPVRRAAGVRERMAEVESVDARIQLPIPARCARNQASLARTPADNAPATAAPGNATLAPRPSHSVAAKTTARTATTAPLSAPAAAATGIASPVPAPSRTPIRTARQAKPSASMARRFADARTSVGNAGDRSETAGLKRRTTTQSLRQNQRRPCLR